jgi:hypothetical protein
MDPRTHQRYLDYLELRRYFARPAGRKLPMEEFAELDAELRALLKKESEGQASGEEVRRIVALRKVLHRD